MRHFDVVHNTSAVDCLVVWLFVCVQTACPSDKDHLQQVMAKIREKKAAERKNLNRKIDRRGGAIQELPEIKKKGKKK